MRALTEAERAERERTPRTEKLLGRLRATPMGEPRALGADDVRRALHCDLPFFAASHTETVAADSSSRKCE